MTPSLVYLMHLLLGAAAVVSAQQAAPAQPGTQAWQPGAQASQPASQSTGMFTPIRLIQPQTSEQRQAIQNLVQELQRISPQMFSTIGTSNARCRARGIWSNARARGCRPCANRSSSSDSSVETSSDSLPFGLHFDSPDSELGSLVDGDLSSDSDSSSIRHRSTLHHSSHVHGSSMSGSNSFDDFAGLDSPATRPAVSLLAVGLALVVAAATGL
ncbi:hypothetical protein IWW54_003391 [Coemansia sp. RSA 2705]|nr:hypothetical protein IWW54_003391 [Coemansia sp. RSA 2705]